MMAATGEAGRLTPEQTQRQQAAGYARDIARNRLAAFRALGLDIAGATLLELGPGRDFGAQLVLAGYGIRAVVADRFLAPWNDDYHPDLYRRLRALWDGPCPVVDQALAQNSHAGLLTMLPEPAEALTTLPDRAIDIVVSHAVLEHVADLAAAARELARVSKPGAWNFHQIDLRDHRDFDRPLEHLLMTRSEFDALPRRHRHELGSQLRRNEIIDCFTAAGFGVEGAVDTLVAEERYLTEFLPRLRHCSGARHKDWAAADVSVLGLRLTLRASA